MEQILERGRGFTAGTATTRIVYITTVPMSLVFLSGQVGYMKDRGFSVLVISSPGDALETFASREHVEARAVEMPRRISPFTDIVALWGLCRELRDFKPRIVHASTPKGGLLGIIAAWLIGIPVRIYHMRGLPLATATGTKRRLLRWTERIACLLANRVISVSHSLRDDAIAEALCPAEKIKVLGAGSGNGVDAANRFNPFGRTDRDKSATRERYGIPADALVVGFVGRVVRDKGIVELLDAWRIVRSECPAAHLLVVGPVESQDPLPPETERALRTDPDIHWVGMDWDTPSLYAAMDVVVLPTYREGFPNVPLEGAAMGLPVVASKVSGCVDAVQDGVTGILIPPRSVEALAGGLLAYLRDPELRKLHGAAGRARVLKEFRQERVWDAIYEEYCLLLTQKGLLVPMPVQQV